MIPSSTAAPLFAVAGAAALTYVRRTRSSRPAQKLYADEELEVEEVATLKCTGKTLAFLLGKEKAASDIWLEATKAEASAEVHLMRVANQAFVSKTTTKSYHVMKLMYNDAAQAMITTFCALKKMTPGDRPFHGGHLMDKIPFLIVVALVKANPCLKDKFAGAYPIGYLPEHEVDNITCVRLSNAGDIVYDRLSVAYENVNKSKKPFKFDIANGTSIRTGILKSSGADKVLLPWVLGRVNDNPTLIAAGLQIIKANGGVSAVSRDTGKQLEDAQAQLMSWSAKNPNALGKTDVAFGEHVDQTVVTVSRTSNDAMPANRLILEWMGTEAALKQYNVRFLDREDAVIFPAKNYGAIVDTLERDYAEFLVGTFDPDSTDTAVRCELNIFRKL
jgi:hypothetical protein